MDYILCEQLIIQKIPTQPSKANEFIKIAAHNCLRDTEAIQTQTQYTIDEIRSITQLDFNTTKEPQWTNFFPQLKALDDHTAKRLFWYSLHMNKKKPTLGQSQGTPEETDVFQRTKRSLMVPYWDTTKNVEPIFKEEWDEYIRKRPKRKCYSKPSTFFKPEGSQFLPFPYEDRRSLQMYRVHYQILSF